MLLLALFLICPPCIISDEKAFFCLNEVNHITTCRYYRGERILKIRCQDMRTPKYQSGHFYCCFILPVLMIFHLCLLSLENIFLLGYSKKFHLCLFSNEDVHLCFNCHLKQFHLCLLPLEVIPPVFTVT